MFLAAALVLAGCSDDDDDEAVNAPTYSVDPGTIDVSRADYCDITQPTQCLLPFPNNFYTRADTVSETGLRVNFDARAIPLNANQDPFDVTEWNRNDGFSPGPMLIAHVPAIDLVTTEAAPLTDVEQSLALDGPIQLVHAQTGERQLIWAEMDLRAENQDKRALIIRVAKNLLEGERYIVVLQNLRDSQGKALVASDAFRVYREAIPSSIPEIEARRQHFEALFATLEGHGLRRDSLYLTWDFTVASTSNITSRVLHMRDTTLADLAGAAPQITVASVQENTVAEDPNWARYIKGTISVPNFLNTADGATGSTLNYIDDDPDALPSQFNGTGMVQVPFDCAIPYTAFDDAADDTVETRAIILGHGLFGSAPDYVQGYGSSAQEQNWLICAMDWWGMSSSDVGTAFTVLGNLGMFATIPDRLQQAFLNKILLSEAIVNSKGFQSLPEFQDSSGTALFKTGEVHYDGVSQGAILGGALSAVNPHFKRAVLNVAGMNWSLIMRRADAWATYSIAFDPAYPDELEQPVMLALTQMLWDRGENNGYGNHITSDPLPGSEVTRVLMHIAVGDQTPVETTAEILARSLQLQRHSPTVVAGRHIAVNPYVGIEPISTYPLDASGMLVWDSGPFPIAGHDGTPLTNGTNLPEPQGYNTHGLPFMQRAARDQKTAFWRTGLVENVCATQPCLADGYDGTPGEYVPQ
jgi:hypothetical protein